LDVAQLCRRGKSFGVIHKRGWLLTGYGTDEGAELGVAVGVGLAADEALDVDPEVEVAVAVGVVDAVLVGSGVLLEVDVVVAIPVVVGVEVLVGAGVPVLDAVGVVVAVRVADSVAVGVAPLPTGTAIVLLHTEPGFFTQNVADEAGPWYPVATIFPDRTETVTS
jgi:hypothetical protein